MKRPMFYLGLAFVFGEILGFVWQKLWLILWLVIAGVCVWSGSKKMHIPEKICVFLLPVFVLWGSVLIWHVMDGEQRALSIADAMPSTFEGVVIEKEVKKKVAVLIVRCKMRQSSVPALKLRCMVTLEASADDDTADARSNEALTRLAAPSGTIRAEDIGLYDRIVVRGQAEVIEGADNPGCYDARAVHRLEQIYYQIRNCEIMKITEKGPESLAGLHQLQRRMRRVIEAGLDEETAGILTAMITGDKSGIPEDINRLYQSQGIAHIMAISGLHVTMTGMRFGGILKLLYVPALLRQMLSMAVVFAYICMCGFSPSSVRAMIMLDAVIIGEMTGRREDAPTVLAVAAMMILVREPLILFSFSFLMSFGCIVSLIIMRSLGGRIAGVYITLITMPLLAWFQYEVSVYGLFLNLIVVPAMGVLFPMALAGSLTGCLWLPAGKMLCAGAGVLLKIFEQLCLWAQAMPLSVMITGRPQVWKMCMIYASLSFFYLLTVFRRRQKKDAAKNCDVGKSKRQGHGSVLCGAAWRYLLLFPMLLLFWNPPPAKLEVLFLDVGQGDGCIIRTPSNLTVMIDGGSSSESDVGKYVLEKVLKYYGVDTIDYMILSHMDQDHVNGALWLLENRWQIGQIVLPGIIDDLKMRGQWLYLARENHIPVTQVFAKDTLALGDVCLKCLHPRTGFLAASDNAASAVIALICGECCFLFTGDIEGDGETQLLDVLQRNGADIYSKTTILKVAHHGSQNSTTEAFLNYVDPEYAIISCGKNNVYGHPHEALLKRLEAAGCTSIVTADSGAVLVQCDGIQADVYSYK